jgi:hypothetical protein
MKKMKNTTLKELYGTKTELIMPGNNIMAIKFVNTGQIVPNKKRGKVSKINENSYNEIHIKLEDESEDKVKLEYGESNTFCYLTEKPTFLSTIQGTNSKSLSENIGPIIIEENTGLQYYHQNLKAADRIRTLNIIDSANIFNSITFQANNDLQISGMFITFSMPITNKIQVILGNIISCEIDIKSREFKLSAKELEVKEKQLLKLWDQVKVVCEYSDKIYSYIQSNPESEISLFELKRKLDYAIETLYGDRSNGYSIIKQRINNFNSETGFFED